MNVKKKSRFITWLKSDGKSYEYDKKKLHIKEEYERLKRQKEESHLTEREKKMIQLFEMVENIENTQKRIDKMILSKSYDNLDELYRNRKQVDVLEYTDTCLECLQMIYSQLLKIYNQIDEENRKRILLFMDKIQRLIE